METLQIDTDADTEHTFILELHSKETSSAKDGFVLALPYFRAPTFAWLFFALFLVLVYVYRVPQDPWARVSIMIENSPNFYIKSAVGNKYFWINGSGIHMTEDFPRIKSSSFRLTT